MEAYKIYHIAEIVVSHQKCSLEFIKYQLNIGVNAASKILDNLEDIGIIGNFKGVKEREVLIKNTEELLPFFLEKIKFEKIEPKIEYIDPISYPLFYTPKDEPFTDS